MFHVKQWRAFNNTWSCLKSGTQGLTSSPGRPCKPRGTGILPTGATLGIAPAAGAPGWLDLGSGAGFPGLVVAALAAEAEPAMEVRLVESDQRKAAFLDTVIRAANLPARVFATRVEALPAQGADVVSARALAPLGALLAMVEKHRRPGGVLACFPRAPRCIKRSVTPQQEWRFEHNIHPSLTEEKGGHRGNRSHRTCLTFPSPRTAGRTSSPSPTRKAGSARPPPRSISATALAAAGSSRPADRPRPAGQRLDRSRHPAVRRALTGYDLLFDHDPSSLAT